MLNLAEPGTSILGYAETWAICLGSYTDSTILSCQHGFCFRCIHDQIKANGRICKKFCQLHPSPPLPLTNAPLTNAPHVIGSALDLLLKRSLANRPFNERRKYDFNNKIALNTLFVY